MKKYILTVALSTIVVLIVVVNVIIPTKYYSSYENRYLATRPKLSLEKILNNEFSFDMEKYINDQFVLRNQWIALKSTVEMLMNKQENNSIYFGADYFLFEKVIQEDKQLNLNLKTLNKFLNTFRQDNIKVVMPLSSYMVYPKHLPKHAPTFNQQQWMDKYSSHWPLIEVTTSFQNQSQAMYYKNDHHWTLDGAYIAYRKIIESYNMIPFYQEAFSIIEIDGFLGSYYAKGKPLEYIPDVLKYINPNIISYSFNEETKESLIDVNQLNQRDKYAAFLYGNPGYAKITVSLSERPKRILIIKDSFANSVIPFLTAHYDEIDVIDLRNFNGSISDIIHENSFESILFLHSFSQFSSDKNIAKLNY